jgi:hypothetical protein
MFFPAFSFFCSFGYYQELYAALARAFKARPAEPLTSIEVVRGLQGMGIEVNEVLVRYISFQKPSFFRSHSFISIMYSHFQTSNEIYLFCIREKLDGLVVFGSLKSKKLRGGENCVIYWTKQLSYGPESDELR